MYCCSIWYRPLSQLPSGAQVGRELLMEVGVSCFIPEVLLYQMAALLLHNFVLMFLC